MKTNRVLVSILLLLAIVTGGFAMIMEMPFDKLVSESVIIAVASMKSANKQQADAQGNAKLENTIVIEEVLKGTGKAGDEIVVDTIADFEDSAVFEPKTKFIVFLTKATDATHYQTTNMIQGYWPIDEKGRLAKMGTGKTKEQVIETIKKTSKK
ncbi:MAG: hypothetical protein HQM09_10775 [Candidatus Riflebacteria bacterium]|nr:hypothetical protein [Candidatus Riflebacteria bacterium]